ncbi:MAG TPA: glucose-6-phosphate dehydrogenase [bacterium]|nr:glucose-6-phosphate dehydrogenase [bacterium]
MTVQARYMPPCGRKEDEVPPPFILVIFGGAGDLGLRKLLPALYHLFIDERLPDTFCILGLGRREKTDVIFRKEVRAALKQFASTFYESSKAETFIRRLHYLSMDAGDANAYTELRSRIRDLNPAGCDNFLFYLSVPPHVLPAIVQNLHQAGLSRGEGARKIVVEKPFGRDRESARELNRMLLDAFDENQICRIDHYLGRETVQNILFFRFGNSIFEPLWNRRYVDHVQIMVSEELGIGTRADFYEQAGVVRDIVQNHALELLALVAMEPPVGFDPDLIRDEKVKVFRTLRILEPKEIDRWMVRGQYGPGVVRGEKVPGYRGEEGVDPGSNTPTFFAGRFMIDNWRWAGVPFYIRTGKRMSRRQSEIYAEFRQPPLRLFGRTCDRIAPNGLVFGIQPDEEISLRLSVKTPGMGNIPRAVDMDFNYEETFSVKQDAPYERLLLDAIRGDLTLFARQDGVEAMWDVVDPVTRHWETHPARDFPNYPAGSWGPGAAEELLRNEGRVWRYSSEGVE